ncbi:TetR/AcrR family transcriptional regulator [Microbacterium sp. CIAB417]|uniref:TetR/AcrR family transcriptional regulator n=1 Tax=Microbacterium sp. CIAB417 TaxID=2860287 RepID=UPI001FAD4C1A|nr:TetR/AcrR family transcriptional regulator [Microbacterium sp. CIAB417]
MNESADSLRDQRKRETARALTDAARRLTADHGFSGFTIEELCAEVGVSRRTFFNYFESKENAIFGFTLVDDAERALAEEFAASSGDIVDDFAALLIRRWALFDPIADAPAVLAVVEQEPRLLKAAFEHLADNERRDIELVQRRAGADDAESGVRAEVVVHVFGALMRLCMDELLHHHSPEPFDALLLGRLEIARSTLGLSQKAD